VKDVDVDPQTGMIYTVDLLPSLRGQQVYAIDPSTGRGTPLPERTGVVPPALVWGLAFLILGMAGAPDGTGFLSTGLVLSPSGLLPYVAEHDADGTFLNDRVLLLADPGGAARRLLDIAFSDAGVLYGIAAPGRRTPSASAGGDPAAVLTAARATPARSWNPSRPPRSRTYGGGSWRRACRARGATSMAGSRSSWPSISPENRARPSRR